MRTTLILLGGLAWAMASTHASAQDAEGPPAAESSGEEPASTPEETTPEETTPEEATPEEATTEEATTEETTPEDAPAEEAPADEGRAEPPVESARVVPQVRPAIEEPVSFTLDNGLRVILLRVPGRRHVAVCTTYRVGSRHVPRGYTGLAHLTEHLMFTGTDTYDGEQLDRWLEQAGVVLRNAETHPDRTVYYNILPVSHVERALWLDATRMGRMLAGLDATRLETQRRVVLQEGLLRGRHGSIGRLASLLLEQMYDDERHPYRRVFEHAEDVSAIRLEHVQRFFQDHYRPDNATLSVVGGFDLESMRAAVHRYFDPIRASGPPPVPPRATRPAPLPVERRVTFDAHVDHDQLILRWPTPAKFEQGDAEMDLLASHLRRSTDGPLYDALRRSGLATALEVGQRSREVGSYFEISATAARGHNTGELLEAIDAVLAELRANLPDAARISQLERSWQTAYRLGTDNLGSLAQQLGHHTPDGSVASTRYRLQRYSNVSRESFEAALRTWILPHRRLVFFVASNPSAPPGGAIYSVRDIEPEESAQ